MLRRYGKLLVLAVTCGLISTHLLSSCAQPRPEREEKDTLKIGAILPLTGDLTTLGGEMKRTLLLAIREINETGGVLGKKIALETCDDGTLPEGARRCFDIMVSKGIRFIVGPATSSNIIKGLCKGAPEHRCDPVKENKVLIISPSATSPLISELDDGGYIWRTAPSDTLQGRVLAQYVSETDVRSVSMIYRDGPYGSRLAEVLEKELRQKATVQIFAKIPYSEIETDFSDEISKLYERGDPEGIIVISFAEDGVEILKTLNLYIVGNNKKAPKLFGVDGNRDSRISKTGQTVGFIKGMRGTAPKPPTEDEDYKRFTDTYRETYGMIPGTFAESTYDAFYLIALGIEAAGEYNPEKVKELLVGLTNEGEIVKPPAAGGNWKDAIRKAKAGSNIDFKGASGKLDFDERGDIKEGYYEIWEIVDTKGTYEDFREVKSILGRAE